MNALPTRAHLTAVPSPASAAPPSRAHADARVRAAAAVLAGRPPVDVAQAHGTDVGQVLRWADALTAAGAGAVGGLGLERPTAGPFASHVPVEDFLSVVAHEVRTPLTAARSGLRVLAADTVASDVRARVAQTVLTRLAELEQLTDDLVTAVEVASGRRRPLLERVDLGAVLEEACATLGLPEPTRPAGDASVLADPLLLRTVADTLLAHAGRYAAAADTAVGVVRVGPDLLATVRLAGVELDPARARALFEPFGDAARGDGNGLALYVVRALVVASGGEVGLAGQEANDSGPAATVLWLRLPGHPATPVVPTLLTHVHRPALTRHEK